MSTCHVHRTLACTRSIIEILVMDHGDLEKTGPNVVSKYVLNTPLLVYSQSDTTIYMYSVVYSVCIVQVYQNAIHVHVSISGHSP